LGCRVKKWGSEGGGRGKKVPQGEKSGDLEGEVRAALDETA